MSALPAFKLPFVSVVDAGRVVGNGRGLASARADALERRQRRLEDRLGRPLRPNERAELEGWANALATEATSLTSSSNGAPAPPPVTTAEGQVLLFRPAPNRSLPEPGNRRPRLCATCRTELPPYPGRGCPRRFCTACRPPAMTLAALEGGARPAWPPRRRRSGATGGQGLLWPELAGACRGCAANLAPYAGLGAPRRWCTTCRPPRRHDPPRTPRVGDRVLNEGAELLVVGRCRLPLGGRRWAAGVEARRENGLIVVIPLADWRATNVEVLHG
jgi:hypothetical protein